MINEVRYASRPFTPQLVMSEDLSFPARGWLDRQMDQVKYDKPHLSWNLPDLKKGVLSPDFPQKTAAPQLKIEFPQVAPWSEAELPKIEHFDPNVKGLVEPRKTVWGPIDPNLSPFLLESLGIRGEMVGYRFEFNGKRRKPYEFFLRNTNPDQVDPRFKPQVIEGIYGTPEVRITVSKRALREHLGTAARSTNLVQFDKAVSRATHREAA